MSKTATKTASTKVPAGWQNRIVGHGAEAPDQLLANPKNWRVHPKSQQDALASVLDRVGWVQEVIVNQRTQHVVDGHLRVSLALSRQEPSIPVKYVDLSPEEESLILATYDPLAAMAGQDDALLRELLTDFETDGALARMLDELVKPDPKLGLTDPAAVPEDVEPISKVGDLWLLGEHRLLCGDSTKAEDVARLMDGAKAAIMWTDPPYGVSYVGKTKDALTIANDGEYGLSALLAGTWAAVGPVMEGGAPFYIARPAGALSVEFGVSILGAGWKLHEELQWVKDAMVLGHSDYHLKHETIMYGWVPGQGRSGRGKHEGSRWYGSNSETSVFEIPRPKASPDHPTGKPVELVERHLSNSSQAADIVLEPFSGSGTTIIAAERLGRRCYAIEIEPRYADVAVRRWEDFTGRKAILDGASV